jgi:hypothetical protein
MSIFISDSQIEEAGFWLIVIFLALIIFALGYVMGMGAVCYG